MREMSFADSLECRVKSRMQKSLLNMKVTNNIIDLDTEEKMLLYRVVQQYVNRISGVQR